MNRESSLIIFSIVNGVLLEPLPYEHAERLLSVGRQHRASGQTSAMSFAADGFNWAVRAADGRSYATTEMCLAGGSSGELDADEYRRRYCTQQAASPGEWVYSAARAVAHALGHS